MDIAANSEDEGALQMLKTMDSLETKINQLQNSVKLFYTSSGIEELMKFVVDFGTTVVNYLNNMPKLFGKLPVTVLTTLVNLISVVKSMLYNGLTDLITKIKIATNDTSQEIQRQSREAGDKGGQNFVNAFKAKIQELKTLIPEHITPKEAIAGSSSTLPIMGKGEVAFKTTINAVGKYGAQLGAALQAAGLAVSNGNQKLAQGLSGVGNLFSGAGLLATGNPLGLVSLFSGVVQLIDVFSNTAEKKIKELEENVEKLKNEALVKKNDYKTLQQSLQQYEQLKKKRYESEEAEQEYLDAVNALAEEYPELIKSYTSSGEAIIELNDKENLLLRTRQESADAALKASEEEWKLNEARIANSQKELDKSLSIISQNLAPILNSEIFGHESIDENGNETGMIDFATLFNAKGHIQNYYKEEFNEATGKTERKDVGIQYYTPGRRSDNSDYTSFSYETGSDTIKGVVKGEELFAISESGLQEYLQAVQKAAARGDADEFIEAYQKFRDFFLSNVTDGKEKEGLEFLNSITDEWFLYLDQGFKKLIETNNELFTAKGGRKGIATTDIANALQASSSASLFDSNSGLFSILTNSYVAEFLEQEDPNLTAENFIAEKIANAENNGLKEIISFYDELDESSKQAFQDAFDRPETYGKEAIKEILGVSGENPIATWIDQYYEDTAKASQERTKNYLEQISKNNGNRVDTVLGKLETILNESDQDFTEVRETFYKNLIDEEERIADKGLTNLAENYTNAVLNLDSYILEAGLSEEDTDALQSLLSQADLTSLSGINNFAQQIEKTQLLDDTQKEEFISLLETLGSSILLNFTTEIGSLQNEVTKGIENFQKELSNASKEMDFSDALEFYKKLQTSGVTKSFESVFEQSAEDPTKWIVKSNEVILAYEKKQVFEAQKRYDEIENKLKILPINGEEVYSNAVSSNLELRENTLKVIAELGLENQFESGDKEAFTEAYNQAILKMNQDLSLASLALRSYMDSYFSYLLNTGNFKEAGSIKGLNESSIEALKKARSSAYQTLLSDFWSGGEDLIKKNYSSYGRDIQEEIDKGTFSKNNNPVIIAETINDLADWTNEEYNEALVKAVELQTKATSGAAQEALKDITFVGDGAFGTLDAVQALADAINIPLDQLTDLMSPDQFGNYKLNLDNEEIRSKIENITNYELLYAESVTNFFDEINGWLEDALGGNLDLTDKANLTDSLGKLGIQIDPNAFTQTVDGFKLAQSEAYRVLTTLQSIDSIAGKVMLSSLVESAMDSDERLNDIFYVMRRIDELNKEINNAEPGTERRKELEGELAVCKEITAELKKADDTFNFMNRDLPSGYDDPLSAWEGMGDAFKVLDGDDFQAGRIGYQDFYNMITMMGDDILYAAGITSEKMNGAANLLDAGAQALVNVDGETFIDLSKLGANFNLGATNMKEGLTKGIHTLAQNQIDMLDAEIAMLETVVQTQEVFDSIAGEDKELSVEELMPTIKTENGEEVVQWGDKQLTLLNTLLEQFGDIEIAGKKLSEIIKDPASFVALTDEDKQKWVSYIQQFYSDGWLADSSGKLTLNGVEIPIPTVSFPSDGKEKFQSELKTLLEGQDLITPEEYNSLITDFFESLEKDGKKEFTISDFIQFAKGKGVSDEFVKWLTENTGIIINEVGGFKKEIKDSTGETVELQWNFEYGTWVSDSGKVYNEDGTETTLEEIKSNKLHDLNEKLTGEGQTPITIEEIEVGFKDFVFKVSGSSKTFSSYDEALEFAISQAQSKAGEVDSETTATETDIEIVPQKIYIKEDSGALGEDGSLLITDPIAKATATVTELEIDPTGATSSIKQAQGAANTPIEIEITDEITGKASTLTITPSATPTLELGEETPTVSDVSATAESATIKPTSYNVDLTDSEGNTQSITVDGTANLETVISGLTKDENGNYSIDSVNGIAQVSAEVSQADTSIQTLWDKWSNKEITFTVKSQEEGGETNTQSSAELRKIVNEKKWSKAPGDNTHAMLTTYREDILSTVSAIQQMTDLGIPVSQEDIQFLRDLQDALTANGGSPAGNNYPTVEALGELADKCVQLNNVSPTVLTTANTLATMDLAQTATYLADMVSNAESLIELEFTNFADLETATETAKTTVDSIATKLSEMTGRTITIDVVEQHNDKGGEGGNSTYTTIYSFNTDNLTTAVTNIQSAATATATAINKIATAMEDVPTDTDKADAISATGKSIKGLPDKKTVKITVSQPKSVSLNAVATLTVKVQGAGSVVSGIVEKKLSSPVNTRINMTSAKGNVALAKGTKTLMGELGPELVVSNGHYFVAGENGAEFVDLTDDAIVFNHLQTKKLLQSGSAGRGTAITNEKKATSMATGNAMASASDALAELKRIRAMWQALLDSSASDLGKKAGSGGGGGGGGKGDDPKAITHDLERWYNLLRQIAKAEQQITLEQAKRKNMQSGYNYSDSLEKELATLKKQEQAYRQLASIQEDWYNIRRKELLDTDFSKIFTYDKDGLMQYVDGTDRGLDILAKLNSTDATGAPTGVGKNSQTQLDYLKSIGFDVEKYLRTNDDGTKAETTDDMMQNFWDRVDGWMDELDGLYDEYNDHLKDIEDNIANQNEILQEYIDNQLSVEEKLFNAIVDRQQAEIDKMQDLLDATQDASEEYINGLTEALNKEQQLYNQNQNDRELSKLQRQLAILQRSGGSASEIKNLQNQIDSRLQSDYFDAMQKQIDAIQEASDNQIEKLQKQIDIATEALEYQKENGLLWQEVYQMMNEWTPEKMLEFIEKYTQSYREGSGLQNNENSKETKKELEIWANKRDMNARDEAWKKYYSDAKYDDTIKKNYESSAQEAFNAGYASGGAEEGARRANEIFENAKKNQGSSTGGNTGGNTSGGSTSPSEPSARGNAKFKKKDYQVYSYDNATTKKKGQIVYGNGKNVSFTVYDEQGNRILISGTDGKGKKIEKRWVPKKYFQYANGGLVDYTGPAWVDGTKSKPEAFLNAKDTELLKSKIFSNSDFSLRSCIEEIQSLADSFRSISTDNSENINIENISIQVGNGTISSDYSARKAGQEIMDEILNVAKKAGNLTLARR